MMSHVDAHPDLVDELEELVSRLHRDHERACGELRALLEHASEQAVERRAIERRVRALATALQRVTAGTYGSCCLCGGAVEGERLMLDPSSPCCERCGEDQI